MEEEDHEIGLLLSAFIAKDLGWQTIYLGANVPSNNLTTAIEIVNPDVMLSMFVTPGATKQVKEIEHFAGETNTTMIFAGNPVNFNLEEKDFKSSFMHSPDDFINFLKNWK